MFNKRKQNQQALKPSSYRIFRRFRIVPFSVIGFLVLSFFLFIGSVRNSENTFSFATKILRVTDFFFQIGNKVSDVFLIFRNKKSLLEEINSLKDQVVDYEVKCFEHNSLKEENDYLRSLLPMVRDRNFKTFTIKTYVSTLQPFVSFSILSPEDSELISVGNAVISSQGLLGRVIENDGKKVTILLANNLQSRIPVISRSSGKSAILFGQNSKFFNIKYIIDKDSTDFNNSFLEDCNEDKVLKEGDILETSGACGFFPPAIPVAVVTKNGFGNLVARWLCTNNSTYMTVVLK